MALLAKATASFVPAPGGVHQAVAVDVVDMGVIEVTYSGNVSRRKYRRIVVRESPQHLVFRSESQAEA